MIYCAKVWYPTPSTIKFFLWWLFDQWTSSLFWCRTSHFYFTLIYGYCVVNCASLTNLVLLSFPISWRLLLLPPMVFKSLFTWSSHNFFCSAVPKGLNLNTSTSIFTKTLFFNWCVVPECFLLEINQTTVEMFIICVLTCSRQKSHAFPMNCSRITISSQW